jgi:hypothetical protein
MWKIRLVAFSFLLFACPSVSAQVGAAPKASEQSAPPATVSDESTKRLRAFVTLFAAACTPELVEQARKESKACALIWYVLDADQPTLRLPNALAKSGYRPIVSVEFPENGDPLKTMIRVAHPQTGLVSVRPVTELASGMTVEYTVRGAETLGYHYRVVGVVFPALCKSYPDKCGMKTYRSRVFDLREYNEDNFDRIAPGRSTGELVPRG